MIRIGEENFGFTRNQLIDLLAGEQPSIPALPKPPGRKYHQWHRETVLKHLNVPQSA